MILMDGGNGGGDGGGGDGGGGDFNALNLVKEAQ